MFGRSCLESSGYKRDIQAHRRSCPPAESAGCSRHLGGGPAADFRPLGGLARRVVGGASRLPARRLASLLGRLLVGRKAVLPAGKVRLLCLLLGRGALPAVQQRPGSPFASTGAGRADPLRERANDRGDPTAAGDSIQRTPQSGHWWRARSVRQVAKKWRKVWQVTGWGVVLP